jgi:hypothetical protein
MFNPCPVSLVITWGSVCCAHESSFVDRCNLVMCLNGRSEHGLEIVKTDKDGKANLLSSRIPVNFMFNLQKKRLYLFFF